MKMCRAPGWRCTQHPDARLRLAWYSPRMSAVSVLSKPASASHRRALDPASARALAAELAPFAQGRSVEEIAEGLETSLSLEEAVGLGELSEAEQREIEGRASREDLEELGYAGPE